MNWTCFECLPIGDQGEALFLGRLDADQPKEEYIVGADGQTLLENK